MSKSKLIKTGYTAICVPFNQGVFILPAELVDKLDIKSGENKYILKVIEQGYDDYPLIIKYEKIENEGSVTTDVSIEKCVLCGYATQSKNITHRLNGKAICSDCAEKLGGMV